MSSSKVSFLDTTNASDEELRLIEEYVQPGKTPPPQIKLPFDVKDIPNDKLTEDVNCKRADSGDEKVEPVVPVETMPIMQEAAPALPPQPHPGQYFPYPPHMILPGQFPQFQAYPPPNMYFAPPRPGEGSPASVKAERQQRKNPNHPTHPMQFQNQFHPPVSGQSPYPPEAAPSLMRQPLEEQPPQPPSHPYPPYSFSYPYTGPNMIPAPPGQPPYIHGQHYPVVYPGYPFHLPVSTSGYMMPNPPPPAQAPSIQANPLTSQQPPTSSLVADLNFSQAQPIEHPSSGPSLDGAKPNDRTDSQKLVEAEVNQPLPSTGDNSIQPSQAVQIPPYTTTSPLHSSNHIHPSNGINLVYGDFEDDPSLHLNSEQDNSPIKPNDSPSPSNQSVPPSSSPSSMSPPPTINQVPQTNHQSPTSQGLPPRSNDRRRRNRHPHNHSPRDAQPMLPPTSPKQPDVLREHSSPSAPSGSSQTENRGALDTTTNEVASLNIAEETPTRESQVQGSSVAQSSEQMQSPSQVASQHPQPPKPVTNKPWASLFKAPGSASETAPAAASNAEPVKFDPTIFMNQPSTSSKSSKTVRTYGSQDIEVVTPADDPVARRLGNKVRKIPLRHSLPYIIPRGFVNRGNWCYVNATLQALITCPPLYNLLREIGEIPGVLDRRPTCTPVLDAMSKLLHSAFLPTESFGNRRQNKGHQPQEELISGDPLEPKCIYDVLELINKETVKGRQEDAEEFLSSLLNKMHEEIVELFKYIDGRPDEKKANGGVNGHHDEGGDEADNDDNLWNEVRSKHKSVPTRIHAIDQSPVREIFGGENVTIRGGQSGFGDRQPFFVLPLDIQSDRVRQIEDSLRLMAQRQQIHGFTDPKTGKSVESQTLIDKLPQILILQLKVFNFDPRDGSAKKLIKKVDFPIELEIPREILYEDKRGKDNKLTRTYKLLTVMYHDGKEAFKGHYLTDNFHIGSQQWIRCDDASIKAAPGNKLTKPEPPLCPYLLFYRRSDTLRAQQHSDRSERDNQRDSHRGGSSKSNKESNRDHNRSSQSSSVENHNRFYIYRKN